MSTPTQDELRASMLKERCGYADLAVRAFLEGAGKLAHGLHMAAALDGEESRTRCLLASAKEAEACITQAQGYLGALKHMAIYAGIVKA